MFANIFYEVSALLMVAAVIGAIATFLRQPLVVAFIAVGILVGPAGLGWVRSRDQVDLLAQMGITLLLFVVGLKLDIRLIRSMGSVALATGLGQVLFTSVVGYFIARALGLAPVTVLYGAVALTAHTAHDAKVFQSAGVDVVLLPFADAAERAVEALTTQVDRGQARSSVQWHPIKPSGIRASLLLLVSAFTGTLTHEVWCGFQIVWADIGKIFSWPI